MAADNKYSEILTSLAIPFYMDKAHDFAKGGGGDRDKLSKTKTNIKRLLARSLACFCMSPWANHATLSTQMKKDILYSDEVKKALHRSIKKYYITPHCETEPVSFTINNQVFLLGETVNSFEQTGLYSVSQYEKKLEVLPTHAAHFITNTLEFGNKRISNTIRWVDKDLDYTQKHRNLSRPTDKYWGVCDTLTGKTIENHRTMPRKIGPLGRTGAYHQCYNYFSDTLDSCRQLKYTTKHHHDVVPLNQAFVSPDIPFITIKNPNNIEQNIYIIKLRITKTKKEGGGYERVEHKLNFFCDGIGGHAEKGDINETVIFNGEMTSGKQPVIISLINTIINNTKNISNVSVKIENMYSIFSTYATQTPRADRSTFFTNMKKNAKEHTKQLLSFIGCALHICIKFNMTKKDTIDFIIAFLIHLKTLGDYLNIVDSEKMKHEDSARFPIVYSKDFNLRFSVAGFYKPLLDHGVLPFNVNVQNNNAGSNAYGYKSYYEMGQANIDTIAPPVVPGGGTKKNQNIIRQRGGGVESIFDSREGKDWVIGVNIRNPLNLSGKFLRKFFRFFPRWGSMNKKDLSVSGLGYNFRRQIGWIRSISGGRVTINGGPLGSEFSMIINNDIYDFNYLTHIEKTYNEFFSAAHVNVMTKGTFSLLQSIPALKLYDGSSSSGDGNIEDLANGKISPGTKFLIDHINESDPIVTIPRPEGAEISEEAVAASIIDKIIEQDVVDESVGVKEHEMDVNIAYDKIKEHFNVNIDNIIKIIEENPSRSQTMNILLTWIKKEESKPVLKKQSDLFPDANNIRLLLKKKKKKEEALQYIINTSTDETKAIVRKYSLDPEQRQDPMFNDEAQKSINALKELNEAGRALLEALGPVIKRSEGEVRAILLQEKKEEVEQEYPERQITKEEYISSIRTNVVKRVYSSESSEEDVMSEDSGSDSSISSSQGLEQELELELEYFSARFESNFDILFPPSRRGGKKKRTRRRRRIKKKRSKGKRKRNKRKRKSTKKKRRRKKRTRKRR